MAKADTASGDDAKILINISADKSQSETNVHEVTNNSVILQGILRTVPLIEPSFEVIQSSESSLHPMQISAETLQSIESIVVVSDLSIREDRSINEIQDYEDRLEKCGSPRNSSIPIVYISKVSKGNPRSIVAPSWTQKLNDCEMLGNSYRGWVCNESDLFLVLTFHKQETNSVWGTRQSPSSPCPAQRLMWKSQYVPFDGIPFINLGSRAIVMECQYGPRRKRNAASKKQCETTPKRTYTQTCPARIYVKKVHKFPEFIVDLTLDKKKLRATMDQAFQNLKAVGLTGRGEMRWYVQLPTEAAHRYHEPQSTAGLTTEAVSVDEKKSSLTVHPSIVEKINLLVQNGEGRVYAIRKQLRRFVEKEMIHNDGKIPEKHNLVFFPTVNDIQNYVYQALHDIQNGTIPLFVQSVVLDPMTDEKMTTLDASNHLDNDQDDEVTCDLASCDQIEEAKNQAHSVTVTFMQPEEGLLPIISRVETKMQDGSIQISTTLTPQSTELLSKLTPNIFPSSAVFQVSATECDAMQEP